MNDYTYMSLTLSLSVYYLAGVGVIVYHLWQDRNKPGSMILKILSPWEKLLFYTFGLVIAPMLWPMLINDEFTETLKKETENYEKKNR